MIKGQAQSPPDPFNLHELNFCSVCSASLPPMDGVASTSKTSSTSISIELIHSFTRRIGSIMPIGMHWPSVIRSKAWEPSAPLPHRCSMFEFRQSFSVLGYFFKPPICIWDMSIHRRSRLQVASCPPCQASPRLPPI